MGLVLTCELCTLGLVFCVCRDAWVVKNSRWILLGGLRLVLMPLFIEPEINLDTRLNSWIMNIYSV